MNNFIVYGLGISGLATAKFLSQNGFNVVVTDDNSVKLSEFSKDNPKIITKKFDDLKFNDKTIISFSPGIPLYKPQPHKILQICQKTGAKLSCDLEIFYHLNRNNKFIGITGTNGKSTTTALVGYILKQLNLSSNIGGNIGIPCFNLPQNQENANYIFEVSSFQIDLMSDSKFDIACLLNITPDHIDRYGSFEKYILSKKRIFLNQTDKDFAIIGVDNHNSKSIFDELLNDKNFKANLIAISSYNILDNGVTVMDGKIFINLNSAKYQFDFAPIIKGRHNDENIACAVAVICCYLIQNSQFNLDNLNKVISIINQFPGLIHRQQFVKKIGNVNFINDSKATNAESTLFALKAFDNIFWILGGRPKEGGIEILKPYFSKIKKAYLIGEASDDFAKIFDISNIDYQKCGDLQNAFNQAYSDTKASNFDEINLLLSPACASLDQWKNFEERGDYFCKLVNEI